MAESTLPSEVWLQIIQDIVSIPDCSSVYLDNKIPGDALCPIPHEYTRAVKKSTKSIRRLLLVSRQLHNLVMPFFLSSVQITTEKQLWLLARSLQNSSQYRNDFSAFVKRLSFYVVRDILNNGFEGASSPLPYHGSYDVLPSQADVERCHWCVTQIVSYCQDLLHISCALPWYRRHDGHTRSMYEQHNTIGGIPGTADNKNDCFLSLPLPLLNMQTLHTLRIGSAKNVLQGWTTGYAELPNLHTLQGPSDIIFQIFSKIQLPSLRHLILGPKQEIAISAAEFFQTHGRNVVSIISLENVDGDYLQYCPNLQDLVVDVLDVMSLNAKKSQIKRLGLCSRAAECPPQSLWELVFQWLVGTYGDRLLTLDVVRIINKRTCRELKKRNTLAMRLWDRRFRDRNIRFEDELGDLMVPAFSYPSSNDANQIDINNL